VLDTGRTTSAVPTDDGARRRRLTRTLLADGVVAGPLFALLWLGQAAPREGFDPTRHAASLLANGPGDRSRSSTSSSAGPWRWPPASG
jgi:hypothetical protein